MWKQQQLIKSFHSRNFLIACKIKFNRRVRKLTIKRRNVYLLFQNDKRSWQKMAKGEFWRIINFHKSCQMTKEKFFLKEYSGFSKVFDEKFRHFSTLFLKKKRIILAVVIWIRTQKLDFKILTLYFICCQSESFFISKETDEIEIKKKNISELFMRFYCFSRPFLHFRINIDSFKAVFPKLFSPATH